MQTDAIQKDVTRIEIFIFHAAEKRGLIRPRAETPYREWKGKDKAENGEGPASACIFCQEALGFLVTQFA